MKDLSLVLAIPNRNGARYLVHALRSLNSQDTPVHWWLQDSQSSDESLELARALARPGDTISCETDRGQADGLNNAIDRMGGDIIGYINSDDALLPGAARRVLQEFHDRPNVDMIVGSIHFIDADGKQTGTHRGEINSLEEVLDVYRIWWKSRQYVQPEVFWRRSLWDKVGKFDTRYNLAFDYQYWVRCFRAGARIHHIDAPLAEFRFHSAQKSKAAVSASNEIRNIVKEALEEPDNLSPLFRWKLENRLGYDRYQSGQDNDSNGFRLPFQQMLIKHPGWLTVPEVRRRLLRSLLHRLRHHQPQEE